jgi:uncharacterized protein involved in outer membrane biogenesis/outer membrane protein OmpA-like peptidoglycan-associated protein
MIAVLVALYALLGFLILPTLAKPKLEAAATQQLDRRATLGKLEFNPFTFRARLSDFALTDRDPRRPFVRFSTLDLDVSLASLWNRAPVLDAVHLVRPQVDLTRNADGTYSIDDLVEKAAKSEGPTTLFSINNIEVDDGSVSLDDQPHRRKIVVSSIGIGIPFLSSLPHDARIRVTPRLEGAIDQARFALRGNSNSPFADTREATLEWNLDALPLAHYAEYLSLPGGIRLTDGALTTRLRLAFVTEKGIARTIALSGAARVDKLALARRDGTALAGSKSVDVALAKLDWLAHSVALERIAVEGPALDLRREATGALELAQAVSGRGPASRAPARPWRFSVADARITDGTVRFADRSVTPEFRVALSKIGFEGKQIASSGPPGSIELGFDSDDGAHFTVEGQVDPAKAAMHGHVALTNVNIVKLYPYYTSALDADITRGKLDVAGDFDASNQGTSPSFAIARGSIALSDLDAAIRGAREPFLRIARADLDGIAIDAQKRSIVIDDAKWRGGSVRVRRQRNGTIDLARLARFQRKSADAVRRSAASDSADGDAWHLLVHKLGAERIAADFEDRLPEPPVKLRIPDARIAADEVSNARAAKSAIEVTARIGSSGRLRVRGAVVADPLAVDWRIDATGIDLVPFRPYIESRTNIVVTRGSVAAKGRLTYAASRAGTPRARYAGDVTVVNFGSLDRPTSQELVRWKTLAFTGVDTASEPLNVAIGAVRMDQFYARVILDADATLNLQQLLAPESAAAAAPGSPATVAGVTTKELPPSSRSAGLPVSIGRIELSNGEVQYSDFFVRPNYSTHLTEVSGSVSALSAAQEGNVELTGRVEGTAPVDVRGTLNPFSQQLALDVTGKATDIDLPPLTPYSVKYAGYGIQKGKLSLDVHYRIDDRKLVATNKLKLDQLTFGEHVDSPTATRLPVLLAVSLLEDRNGVINLDLPIQGTLDDPQFSVWGVLVQIFVNLVTKAVTAPFALLSSIGGGGGEQLAYVAFAPGHAELSEAAQAKLQTLAKALTDRPALKIDAAGRAVPDADREGLKRAMLDGAIRSQKLKALAAEGQSAPPLDSLTINAAEYPKLLTTVYRAADFPDKPRNVLGITKTIPPAEMEALLLKSYRVDDQALATLANRRAQTVKQWITSKGGVAPERVFIVAPKLTAAGIDDKGSPTRVDFAIR